VVQVDQSSAARSSQRWSASWHAALAVIVAFALVAQLGLLFAGGADANSGRLDTNASLGVRLVRFFSYFTVESNLLVMFVSAALAINPERDGRGWRVLQLDALLGIVITGLVFDLVLAKIVHLSGLAYVVTVCFHYISPWMMLLGWLAFGPRPRITWATVGWAFAWPLLWIGYTLAHGAATGWYPYPFLNPVTLGYHVALRNTVVVVLVAAIMAMAFKALDRWLPLWRAVD
jgi:hypothetical protein